jgi:hypothetical protein
METLLLGFFLGLIATLITTWITARMNKSTDTRTQLLLKIDDWVNEVNQFCDMIFWNLRAGKLQEEVFNDFEKLESNRWKGVTKGLNNKLLADKVDLFKDNISEFGIMLSKAVSVGNHFDDSVISNKEILLNRMCAFR